MGKSALLAAWLARREAADDTVTWRVRFAMAVDRAFEVRDLAAPVLRSSEYGQER